MNPGAIIILTSGLNREFEPIPLIQKAEYVFNHVSFASSCTAPIMGLTNCSDEILLKIALHVAAASFFSVRVVKRKPSRDILVEDC
jgi:hypothetical protein